MLDLKLWKLVDVKWNNKLFSSNNSNFYNVKISSKYEPSIDGYKYMLR